MEKEQIEQLIEQRETIIKDLSNSHNPDGIAIRFGTYSTTFLSMYKCDYSDIIKLIVEKVQQEINLLKEQVKE